MLRKQLEFGRDLRQRTDKLLAEDFSIFSYIEMSELSLSQITADLLDCNGTHGQGDAFLRAFLHVIECDAHAGTPKVKPEDLTWFIERSRRRIDVTVRWNDGFILAIENKPWAGDQDVQLEDYIRHLDGVSHGEFLMVYLSQSGGEPSTKSISANKLESLKKDGHVKILNYSSVMRGWLRACLRECQAEKIRWFLRDFENYLTVEFQADISAEDNQ